MIMMTIAQIMEKMIAFSEGNIHDRRSEPLWNRP